MRFLYTLLIAFGALVLMAGAAPAQEKSATLRLLVRAETADKILVKFEIYLSPQALASAQRAVAAQAKMPGAPQE